MCETIGSGLNYDLLVNQLSNILFCLCISICFIIRAEPAHQGCITMEPTSNLFCLHSAPVARQVSKVRPRLGPRALPSRCREIVDAETMNLSDSGQ
jgi:hypothetical protein